MLIENLGHQCLQNVVGKKIIAFCDTTSFNVNNHKKRITDFEGLGSLGKSNGKQALGFWMHPILVHEQSSGVPLGISSVQLWSRPEKSKRPKSKRYETKDICIEEKESYKWLGPCLRSREKSLSKAEHIIFVMDREGDIMEVYDRIPNEHTDVLCRVMHNRRVQLPGSEEKEKLYDYIARQDVSFSDEVNIQCRKRKKRNAEVEIRIGKCRLQWSKRQKVSYKNNPDGVGVTIIEVREKTHKGYRDEPPLLWRLITTQKIQTKAQAREQIRIYTQRWRIEEFFKLLKSDGFKIESTELQSGKSIRKLTLILMKVSIKIQQLKAARDGKTNMKVSDFFDQQEIKCLESINVQVNGNTVKQQNPFDPENLAWATWIIARLGGWQEFYDKSRPPGHKTLIWGMDKFDSIMIGYNLSKNKDVS